MGSLCWQVPKQGGAERGRGLGLERLLGVSEEDTLAVCALQTSSRVEGEPLLILN